MENNAGSPVSTRWTAETLSGILDPDISGKRSRWKITVYCAPVNCLATGTYLAGASGPFLRLPTERFVGIANVRGPQSGSVG
jgi:hypothetical protein